MITVLGKILFVMLLLLSAVPFLVWAERRISAGMQGRLGPNRVGPLGLFQPLADAIKFIFKEDIIPLHADRFLYVLAPTLVLIPPFIGFAVIPFANSLATEEGLIPMQVADLSIGILFLMSFLSVGVYGLAFGGWASNSKYSLLGGLRASAQLISYEVTLGLSIIAAIMLSGSIDLRMIVERQAVGFLSWNIFGGGNLSLLPCGLVGCFLFYVAALAENNRLPFDLSECEAELVAGYHTEYSSMKFAMFFMGEYVAMILMSALMATLYLGGWSFPGLTDPNDHSWQGVILSFLVFAAKVGTILFLYIWIRWTLPRFKYNQLMDLGWKRLIPISLANVGWAALAGVLL